MRFCTLFSGSSGNCIYVEADNTRILVDAGKNMKAITNALKCIGVRLDQIDAILLTHGHSDHISAIPVIANHFKMPIMGRLGTLDQILERYDDLMPNRFMLFDENDSFLVGNIVITPFSTPHDIDDSTGYSLVDQSGNRLTIATDLGYVTEEIYTLMKQSAFVVIEANYDEYMLDTGIYPYYLKCRVKGKNGHLSNDDCACTICRLVDDGVKHFLLAHLSENNNLPHIASGTIIKALTEKGVCPGEVTIDMAPRHDVSRVFEI